MGNRLTCRVKASPSPRASPKLGGGSKQVKSKCEYEVHEEAAGDTGAMETVPATPKSEKLKSGALKRHHLKNISAPVIPQEQYKRKNNYEWPERLARGYGSCPMVFLSDDTIRQPDFKITIQTVSLGIYHIIKNRDGNKISNIFDESKHPFRHEVTRKAHLWHDPELKVVYRFVRALFSAEHLTAECAIVTLIFIERLLDYSDINMCPRNWRRILVGSALLAYEYWDKQALWGIDFCQLINNIITPEDMNDIERHFLRFIQFDIKITSSKYASYYFYLLRIAEEHNVIDLFEPFAK
ncbi:cyclin-Y-like protein 1 [Eptesicus fuscus]|uniref:cyclin-Y-like protein 1 n=1 Tax=Eptesicus fuscus TaxID=29078 RepID=UPI002403A923|nr:cyclin-Y-like protein 1 [Eptesicus fuscus]